MVKNIIKYFGYLIAILVIIVMYLSYFGIETKQFNELIKDRVEQTNQNIDIELNKGSLRSIEPLSYRELVAAVIKAEHIITDSGGLQKESFHLGTPCTTVRTETEWVETLTGEWNKLVEPKQITDAISRPRPSSERGFPFGKGDAADNIAKLLLKF